jgi:hypothetical protein
LPLYRGTPYAPTVRHRGIVTLGCNIHDDMIAYLSSRTPPGSAAPIATAAERKRLAAGEFRVEVWHPGCARRPSHRTARDSRGARASST